MSWDSICERIDEYAQFARPVAASIRPALAFAPCRVALFANPITRKVAFDAYSDARPDFLWRITKASCLPVRAMPLTQTERYYDSWIKVAESTPLRSVLENLQYLPSASNIPNAPSPLAATIASSLVGAGLGYGAGATVGLLTPDAWNRKRLRRNSMIAGGLLGAAPGVIWGLANAANDKSVTSPWPNEIEPVPPLAKGAEDDSLTVGYEGVPQRAPGPADVNMNSLGQVLWNNQLPAPTTAATLGTMHAASQFPDPTAPSGWVTAHQLGQLAMATGQGYAVGTVAGKALNILTGMPTRYGSTAGAALGILNFTIPRLYG